MWSTLPYLVKVQICFALLWIVYRFFLQRDGRFARSRAYLLLSVPVSFLIPLLSIPVLPASQPAPVPAVPVAAVAEAPVRAQPVSAAEDASLFAEAAPAARNKFLPNSPTNCFPRSVIPPMRFRPPCRPKRPRRKGRYSFPGTIPSRRMMPNRPLRYSPVRLSRTHPVFPDTVLRFRGSLLPYSASRQRAMMS